MLITGIRDKLSFAAGKVDVYSDFDGTYCPARHSSLHNPNENGFMVEYCDKMDKFLRATRGDVHFNITTGRTFGEYESISWLLKMRDFRLPFPETVITKDGSDRFVRKGSDKDFYERGKFPFEYNSTLKEKERQIKELTNWDGGLIHSEIRNLAGKYQIRLVEADSEHSVSDYGERSLFSAGKLNINDWQNLPREGENIKEHKIPVAEYVLGSRNDGNLKFHLIFPPDYGFCPERNWIYDNFVGDLKSFMSSKNIQYDLAWEPANSHNHHRISCSFTPKFESGALTKLYDTKMALRSAIKNDDIVIAAGDGSNDFDMLNPLKYLDETFVKDCENRSSYKDFYRKEMPKRLDDLRRVYCGENSEYINGLRKELSENGYLKKLEELPIYSVVINKKNSKLQPLLDTFSGIGKVIAVEIGNLDEGIKNIIKNHAQKNKGFKAGMSEKLQVLIDGAKKKSLPEEASPQKSLQKSFNYPKVVFAILGLGILSYVGYKYLNKSKDKNNENNTNINSQNIK